MADSEVLELLSSASYVELMDLSRFLVEEALLYFGSVSGCSWRGPSREIPVVVQCG